MTTTRTPINRGSRHRYPKPWDERPISRASWQHYREELLAAEHPGSRPPEWWVYEKNMSPPSREDEADALYAMGELSEVELTELTPEWREQYERTLEPGFAHCIGHAKAGDTFAGWIEGEAARQAHCHWAGIPRAIVEQWDAERRRRACFA